MTTTPTIVALGGEPASGKTTIFKLLRARFERVIYPFQYGLVRGMSDRDMKVLFIGVYDNSTWEGCDKLSMSVQPDFEKMVKSLTGKDCVIYIEGDRLFNPSLFRRFQIQSVVIQASPGTLSHRHKLRADNQGESFLKAKRTKLRRMVDEFKIRTMPNETPEDQKLIVDWLHSKAKR